MRPRPTILTSSAADAMSAVVQARRHQPYLIILDLSMLAGGGFAVMDRLRASTYLTATPVVVAVLDREADEELAMQAEGCIDNGTKPAW